MAMAALQGVSVLRGAASVKSTSQLWSQRSSRRAAGARSRTVAMATGATKGDRSYKLTVLPGDGIGPEIIKVAIDVLRLVGSQEGEDSTLVQLSSVGLWRCLNLLTTFLLHSWGTGFGKLCSKVRRVLGGIESGLEMSEYLRMGMH